MSFLFCCSPSICHSDSDLSEGSRKYSPSSETSLETQRACGKAQTCRTHSHASTKLCGASFIRPSLTEMEDYSSGQTILSFTPFFTCAIAKGSSCSHLCVPFFFVSCFVYSSRLHLSGGFSETYSALCDYNGISCKEEVQWVRALGLCHCECF